MNPFRGAFPRKKKPGVFSLGGPEPWNFARFITPFAKGPLRDPGEYWGISPGSHTGPIIFKGARGQIHKKNAYLRRHQKYRGPAPMSREKILYSHKVVWGHNPAVFFSGDTGFTSCGVVGPANPRGCTKTIRAAGTTRGPYKDSWRFSLLSTPRGDEEAERQKKRDKQDNARHHERRADSRQRKPKKNTRPRRR